MTHESIQVDDSLKVEEVEFFYDPAELFGGLLSGKNPNNPIEDDGNKASPTSQCPFSN